MTKSIKTQLTLLFALLALSPIAIIFAIYGPAMTRQFWYLLLLMGVGVVITATFISRRVSEPLISLAATAKKIAQGNLEERATIASKDELGELASCLNTMADSLRQNINELEETNKKLAAASTRDGLTGLYNYSHFTEMMDLEYKRAKRYNLPLSLLMIDLDHFKLVNDNYGHPFGDFVLKEVARIIRQAIRDIDIPGRYGGEEFTIIFPNTDLDGAYTASEKLRQDIAEHCLQQEDLTASITITVGLSSLAEDGIASWQDMLKHADEAMYEGKLRGRNMVVSWGELEVWERVRVMTGEESLEHYRQRFLHTAATIKRSYMEATMALVKALEARDNYTATQCYLTATFAVKLAEELGVSKENIEVIKNAAILHDIGKISLPETVLQKSGELTDEERALVKKHPEYGAIILGGVGFLHNEIPIILHHHERFDGQGYPQGLKGTAIPLGARILALADAYAAMTSPRPYRKGLSHQAAIEKIREGSGRHFDPNLAEHFIKAVNGLRSTAKRIYIAQLNKMVDIS